MQPSIRLCAGLDLAREPHDVVGAAGVSPRRRPIEHTLNLEHVVAGEETATFKRLIFGRGTADTGARPRGRPHGPGPVIRTALRLSEKHAARYAPAYV